MKLLWSAKIPWKPPSSNHSYLRSKNGRMYMPKEVREYKDNVGQFASITYNGSPIKTNLYAEVTHIFNDNRKRDVQNLNKALFDALENIIYVNDTQIKKILMELQNGKEEGTIIKLYDYV